MCTRTDELKRAKQNCTLILLENMKHYEKTNRRTHHKKSTPEELNALVIEEYINKLKQPKLHCICCEKELSPVCDLESLWYQPDHGVICNTYGNYGSEVFDALDSKESLHFFLCDTCLLVKAKHVFVFKKEKQGYLSFEEEKE